MLKDRDKKVLKWIEDYGAISLKQANTIFLMIYMLVAAEDWLNYKVMVF